VLKVKNKPLWEWWIKDVCDVGYETYKGTWSYDNEDVGFAVFLTLIAVVGAIIGTFVFISLVLMTKGILLLVLTILGALAWAIWKSIKALLDKEGV
jgi:hypothetical protein